MPEPIEAHSPVSISGIVNMETVANLRAQLIGQITSSNFDDVEVDMHRVEIQGSAVIALLISITREARAVRKKVIFCRCPDRLIAIARACGVDGILTLARE
ncbi:MAG: STAS domain-containing protein [Pseudomonadales bacterium]